MIWGRFTRSRLVARTLGGVMAGRTPANWGEEALVLKAPGENPGDTNRWKEGFWEVWDTQNRGWERDPIRAPQSLE